MKRFFCTVANKQPMIAFEVFADAEKYARSELIRDPDIGHFDIVTIRPEKTNTRVKSLKNVNSDFAIMMRKIHIQEDIERYIENQPEWQIGEGEVAYLDKE